MYKRGEVLKATIICLALSIPPWIVTHNTLEHLKST